MWLHTNLFLQFVTNLSPTVNCGIQVHYVADSETEQVEWFSALEGAVAKIVRAVAGLEEEEPTTGVEQRSSSSGRDRDWANQLERGFASVSKGGSSGRSDGNAMVNIVGYSGAAAPPAARRSESFAADNGNYGGTINFGQIAGTCHLSNKRCFA